jgi:GT2 family glycosyltransferase
MRIQDFLSVQEERRMIYSCVAYAPGEIDLNLGATYNRFMKRLGVDDWACFIDHDCMTTTPFWYKQLETAVEIIESGDLPIGLITAVTNRIGNVDQIVFRKRSPEAQNHDMYFHRRIGSERLRRYGASLREAKRLISGVIMLTPKRVWKKAGGFRDGFLGVDNDFDRNVRAAGYKTCIMDGLYVYHWYRADGQPIQGHGYSRKTNLPEIE